MDTKDLTDNSTCTCSSCGFEEKVGSQPRAFCSQCRFPLLLLGGRFRLITELAVGGFGTVYLAKDLQEDQQVVIKVIKPELVQTESLLIRFRREIRITALLSELNEHIVRIVSHGTEKGVGHYYAMEYLDGMTLSEYIDETEERSMQEIFWIFRQFCEVMQDAHQNGIVHRDLKPDNLFLIPRGEDKHYLKVLDFGIAKPLHGTAHEGLTSVGMGTPHYMAPEQCINQPIDARADIYSMGIILYELLTQSVPFTSSGDNPISVIFAHMQSIPEPITLRKPELSISEELNDVVLKALEKKPEDRFQSTKEFWDALSRCPDMPGTPTEADGVPAFVCLRKELAPTGIFIHDELSLLQAEARTLAKKPARPKHTTTKNIGLKQLQSEAIPTAEEVLSEPSGRPQTPLSIPMVEARAPTLFDEEAKTEISPNPLALQPQQTGKSGKVALWGAAAFLLLALVAAGLLWFTRKPSVLASGPLTSQTPKPQKTTPARKSVLRAAPLVRPGIAPNTSRLPGLANVKPMPLRIPEKHLPKATPKPVRAKPQAVRSQARSVQPRLRRKIVRRAGPCAAIAGGLRAIFGKMLQPAGVQARIKLLGCKGCRVRKRGGGYCLLIPPSYSRTRVRIYWRGYQTCTHWTSTKTRQLLWTLKEENPDDLGGSSYYQCAKAKP